MICEICLSETSVDSLLWKCIGCSRAFHATCVGVTVQRNSLRRKDKKVVDMNSYLLPCCDSCQEHLQAKMEFHRLADQQKLLTEQLHANTEVMHRFTLRHENPGIVHEAVEGLEVLLIGIKNELSAISKNNLAGSVVAIKNHITSLFDVAMISTKDNISTSLKTVTSDISTDLRNINNAICELNQLSLEMAASCNVSTNPVLELDILDELKSMRAALASTRCAAPLSTSSESESYPSLEAELNDKDKSGWRLLGTRKVWKADWTEYDARKLRRLNQQKKSDKAKRRKQQRNKAKRDNNYNHSNNNYHSNNLDNKNNNINRPYHHGNNTSFNNNNRNNINHTNNHSHHGYNNERSSRNFISHHRVNQLPPDRELLAAAKARFSSPPVPEARPIQFQRGEILNPYPASTSAASCAGCSCRHTCFQRN